MKNGNLLVFYLLVALAIYLLVVMPVSLFIYYIISGLLGQPMW